MLKRVYHYIAGDNTTYRFEHRVFNLTSFVITLFCLQATLINYLLGLHWVTVWLAVLGTLISATLFYLSRVRNWFTPATIFIYITGTIVVLGSMHFYNGASYGTIIYLIIMLLNIFLLIAQRRHQLLIYSLLAGAALLLIVVEYFFPQLVVPYASIDQRLTDHLTVLVYSLFFTMLIIVLFRRSYDREQKMVLDQKRELEEAYRLTTEKNEYIESLVRELHHRVKNNLQIVSSLLSLQSNRLEDDKARMALEEGRTRVDAMAMIHQQLYMENDLAAVNIEDYLGTLTLSLAGSFGYNSGNIRTVVQLQNQSVDIDMAIPIGLIVNELVTNSFKHAFHGVADPRIIVSLQQQSNDRLILTIADNGNGLKSSEALNKATSFGIKLVNMLVDQLNGVMTIRESPGITFTIEIRA